MMSKIKVAFTKAAHKFHVAIGATVAAAIPLVSDGDLSEKDAIAIGIFFLGAIGVFVVRNPPAPPDDDPPADPPAPAAA